MKEEWRPIAEVPHYHVSNHGRVLNERTGRMLTLSVSQFNIVHVGLFHNNIQRRRSVAKLVATTFLPPPKLETFNTVINKDGDRRNNFAVNLDWRPLWFTGKYHAQFREEGVTTFGRIADMETGEEFTSVWDAATQYGLLVSDIYEAIANNTYVWPTGQRFWRID